MIVRRMESDYCVSRMLRGWQRKNNTFIKISKFVMPVARKVSKNIPLSTKDSDPVQLYKSQRYIQWTKFLSFY